MATLLMPGALLSQAFAELTRTVITVSQTTNNFKHELKELKDTLDGISPIIDAIGKLNLEELGRTGVDAWMLIDGIHGAEKLVLNCSEMKSNILKRFNHSRKLKEVNDKLLRLFQNQVQGYLSRDIKETLVEVKNVSDRMRNLDLNVREQLRILDPNVRNTRNLSKTLSREREKWGWRVPILSRRIVVFSEPLAKLKARVLDDLDYVDDDRSSMESLECHDGSDDSSLVVVTASGGCGKTTLVTMLCYHPDIRDIFGENIFYVKVSKTTNFFEIVNDLFNPDPFSAEVQIQTDADAKNALEKFFLERVSCGRPVLLVLDDVLSDSFIKNFEFKITGYKIIVTTRLSFPLYYVFPLDPLCDEDAKTLFHSSAFNEHRARSSSAIDEDIVKQMVKHCNKHPLTLSAVGGSLNGKCESVWKFVLKTLSKDQWNLDNNDALKRLERTIEEWDEEFQKWILDFEALDEEFKKCLLDFRLFPEHQRIPGCALVDIWACVYDHDDMGRDTLTKIFELSSRKLVSSVTIGEEANAIVNYCEQTFVTQQDLLWELAIHMSSKEPIAQRTRLIIDARGEDLPASIQQVNEPMQARILSISTGELFLSRWCNMTAPEVEILVLNIMSEAYTLPQFLDEMQKLKILNVTNYGSHPIELGNSHLFGSLTNLRRIRLEHIAISPLSTSILELVNLEKISLIMCKIGNSFDKLNTSDYPNIWPRLVQIEMDYCQDLLEFPKIFCNSVHLEKLSITNCKKMCGLPEEFGNLTNLEILSLRSCTKLERLTESITRLEKLRILDISDCLSLRELPEQVGKLAGLQMIYMKGCTQVYELPLSVKELTQTQVFCDEELSSKWQEFPNVKVPVVEEDRLLVLAKNIWYVHDF